MERLFLIGGDARQEFLANHLTERGYRAERVTGADLARRKDLRACGIILPLPASRDGETVAGDGVRFADLAHLATTGALLLGGQLPPAWCAAWAAGGGRYADYYTETVALRNALPTAEGAIRLAMEGLPVTLSGARVAVTGYGRVGALLARKLTLLGARVTVLARSPLALAEAEINGAEALPLVPVPRLPEGCRAVFNTVPARILPEEALRSLPAGCLMVELASAPYGFDATRAAALGLRVLPAPGLPGRFYPETAGRILADAVCPLLREPPSPAGDISRN